MNISSVLLYFSSIILISVKVDCQCYNVETIQCSCFGYVGNLNNPRATVKSFMANVTCSDCSFTVTESTRKLNVYHVDIFLKDCLDSEIYTFKLQNRRAFGKVFTCTNMQIFSTKIKGDLVNSKPLIYAENFQSYALFHPDWWTILKQLRLENRKQNYKQTKVTTPAEAFENMKSSKVIRKENGLIKVASYSIFDEFNETSIEATGISLKNNSIEELSEDLLRNLSSLQSLDLSYNLLANAPANLFDNSSVQYLWLSFNQISNLFK